MDMYTHTHKGNYAKTGHENILNQNNLNGTVVAQETRNVRTTLYGDFLHVVW